jgi:hypothetical protein
VQVCKFVTEERVEPVSIQVMKYVTEQRTAQVPRVVEKKVPYTYTVRSPRTVVVRVSLDPCGNPIPAAVSQTSTVGTAPAAVARPTSAPSPVAPPSLAPTPAAAPAPEAAAAPTKTFSDKSAVSPAAEGWTGSGLQHVDPKQAPATGNQASGNQATGNQATGNHATGNHATGNQATGNQATGNAAGAIRAEKPTDTGNELRSLETIPTPTGKDAAAAPAPAVGQSPTVAPLNLQPQSGPAVEPAPPASDPKDVPASETSGRLLRIVPPVDSHTT